MAWGSVGSGSTASSTGADQSSLVHTLGATAISSGNFAAIVFAQLNATSVNSIDGGVVSTVNDSAGNTWLKAKEWQNGGGAAAAGAVCSLWYTNAVSALSSGTGTITATFLAGSSASFDASASAAWIFTVGGPAYVLDSTANITTASTDTGSIDLNSGSTGPYLRFRGVASRSTATFALSTSAGWTGIGVARALTGGGAVGMGARGEFLITASSTAASAPTFNSAKNHASVYVIFAETAPAPGSASGDATAAAVGADATPSGPAVGSAQGDAAASGFLSADAAFDGAAQGDAAASGILSATALFDGSAQGDAVASGALSATALFVGTAVGDAVAVADGMGVGLNDMAGTAVGDAIALAVGEALAAMDGAAVGDAAADAGSLTEMLTDGLAEGDSFADAASSFVTTIFMEGVGTATGDSIANGFAGILRTRYRSKTYISPEPENTAR